MSVTGPLFKWFGSKWSSSKRLPPPHFSTIIEPFAGSAGYALRHAHLSVFLYETDPWLRKLWQFLISEATYEQVMAIPVEIPVGTDIRHLDLSEGQGLLLKTWQRTNNVGNCWTISPWGNKPGQWTVSTRERVSRQVECIKHWTLCAGDAFTALSIHKEEKATWFLDPPYEYNYKYKSAPIQYSTFASLVHSVRGEVIACEARDPDTGKAPTYLPFVDWEDRITSRRKQTDHKYSKELLYHHLPLQCVSTQIHSTSATNTRPSTTGQGDLFGVQGRHLKEVP
jgi:hypothetical protein